MGAFILLGIFLAPVLLKSQVKNTLQDVFKDSEISVGALSIEQPLSIALADIHIKNKQNSIDVKKVSLDTSLKMVLQGLQVKLSSFPAKWLPGEKKSTKPFLRSVELRDLSVQCRLPDLSSDIQGSLEIDPVGARILSASLSSPSIKSKKIELKEIKFQATDSDSLHLSIAQLTYDKLKVSDIRGTVTLSNGALEIKPLTGAVVDGKIDGFISVKLGQGFSYRVSLDLNALELDTFTREFELENKMSASGKLTGKIALEGDLSGLRSFSGDFSGSQSGGDLVIQDQNFLNTLANNVHQPVALVEAGFKEYHFDTARMSLALDKRDLNFLINLNGEKGKRDFEIKLHDLFQSGG